MRNRLENKKTVVGLIIIFALLFFCVVVSIYQMLLPKIVISVDDIVIRQEEQIPEIQIRAQFQEKEQIILDESSGYSTKELLRDLNCGNGLKLSYDMDNQKEGTKEIKVSMEQELKRKFAFSWNQKIRYHIENGTITVLNKYGDWEGRKFRYLDGTYASGWTNLGKDTYYFDEQGEYVSGKKNIHGIEFQFKKNGLFDTKKNPANPNRPMIALTFDDGPGAYTMQLLECLEQYHSRATFFLVGYNVNKYPDAIKKMKAMGCQVGNHTTNHPKLTLHTPETIMSEIATTNAWIEAIIGEGATLVRPPYGSYNQAVQDAAMAPLIMWSMDPKDWESKNISLIQEHILANLKDGDIILLHDIHETTVLAMMELIPKLIDMGYQLVTVSDMAYAKGITLQNGVVYKSFP